MSLKEERDMQMILRTIGRQVGARPRPDSQSSECARQNRIIQYCPWSDSRIPSECTFPTKQQQMEPKTEKFKIVIDIGQAIIRVGLTSMHRPLLTQPILQLTKHPPLIQQWVHRVISLLLFQKLDNLPVILVININAPREPVRTIVHELFIKFGAGLIEYLPAVVMPLSLTGLQTGICLHSSYSCTDMIALYSGYPLLKTLKYSSACLKQLLIFSLKQAKKTAELTDALVQQAFNSLVQHKDYFFVNDQKIACDWKKHFFGNWEEEEQNLAATFLTGLMQVPKEQIQEVANNVVLSGSLWNIPGTKKLFTEECQRLLKEQPQFYGLGEQRLVMSKLPYSFEERGCIGASLFGHRMSQRQMIQTAEDFKERKQYHDRVGKVFLGLD